VKNKYFLIFLIGMGTACSLEQELIIVSKNKKKYVSEQQYAELDGEMVGVTHESSTVTNLLQGSLISFQQVILAIQKKAMNTLNDYIDGEKDGFLKQADKVRRTDCYEKLTKLNNTIESYTQKIYKMQQQLDSMHVELQQQYQEILNLECDKSQKENSRE
jgi:hypothetical protein